MNIMAFFHVLLSIIELFLFFSKAATPKTSIYYSINAANVKKKMIFYVNFFLLQLFYFLYDVSYFSLSLTFQLK